MKQLVVSFLFVMLFSTPVQSDRSKGSVRVMATPRQVSADLTNPQPRAITCVGKLFAKTSTGKVQTASLEKCVRKDGDRICEDGVVIEPHGEFYLYLSVKGKDSTTFVKGWHNIICSLD